MNNGTFKKISFGVIVLFLILPIRTYEIPGHDEEIDRTGARKFLEITSPVRGDTWRIGGVTVISWKSTGIRGGLVCELFYRRNKVRTIFRDVAAQKGSYSWNVSGAGMTAGSGYQIRITSVTDNISETSEIFSIEETQAAPPKEITPVETQRRIVKEEAVPVLPIGLKVTAPRYMDKWEIFEEYAIRWESKGLKTDDEIGIALKTSRSHTAKIIGVTRNTGKFLYRVPYPNIYTGYDIQVVLTPIKDRSIEVFSEPFQIEKPAIDLISNSPSITLEVERRKRKWWEHLGDVFTMGLTRIASDIVDVAVLNKQGATLIIEVNVVQKGSESLRNVGIECAILTRSRNVVHSFPAQRIDTLHPERLYPLTFSGRTREMNLKSGNYIIEINLDPFNEQGEADRLRENNRISVSFEVR